MPNILANITICDFRKFWDRDMEKNAGWTYWSADLVSV